MRCQKIGIPLDMTIGELGKEGFFEPKYMDMRDRWACVNGEVYVEHEEPHEVHSRGQRRR